MRLETSTAILADGSLASLVACALLKEALTSSQVPSDARGLVIPFFPKGATNAQVEAARVQAASYDLPVAEAHAKPEGEGSQGEGESRALLSAGHIAARAGLGSVLWPVQAAVGEGLDLDRISACADRALLVGRLVAIDAVEHGVRGLTISIPFIDLTDRQIAELAMDMGVPLQACWWNRFSDRAAGEERARWMAALRSVGWTEHARATI
jgi:hypothetical protein